MLLATESWRCVAPLLRGLHHATRAHAKPKQLPCGLKYPFGNSACTWGDSRHPFPKHGTRGYKFTVDADDESTFEDRISRALASEHDVVVAAGGDGTASGIASALVGSDKTLAVMPSGTVNSLAKDLSVPLDIDAWVASLGSMEKRRVDVGEVNGRIFLHMVVIGLIPSLAAGRELLRGQVGVGAKIGLLQYFLRRLARTRRLAVQIDPEGETARIERVQSIAISCNPYEEAAGSILKRETLDAGELTLYTLKQLGTWDIVRLGTEMPLGRWKQDEALSIQSVPAVTIRSRKPRLQVMIDGETQAWPSRWPSA